MKKILSLLAICNLSTFLTFISFNSVMAQSMSIETIHDAGTRNTDMSFKALVSVFGDVVQNPLGILSSEGADSLLVKAFLTINAAISIIAGILLIYYLFKVVYGTAKEGSFGSAATGWSAMRVLFGFAALIPTASGWSLAQLIMLYGASIGIGLANITTDAAVVGLGTGVSMIAQPADPESTALAQQMFEMNLCRVAINTDFQRQEDMGIYINPRWKQQRTALVDENGVEHGFRIKAPAKRKQCGTAYIDTALLESQKVDPDGFVPGIDTTTVYQAHILSLKSMETELYNAADQFVKHITASRKTSGITIPDPALYINRAARNYEKRMILIARERDGDLNALADAIGDDISEQGWWMLGTYYQTFAMANSKLGNAIQGAAKITGETFPHKRDRFHKEVLTIYESKLALSDAASPLAANSPLASAHGDTLLSKITNAPLQSIVASFTTLDFERGSGTITDPLIKMKGLGDVIMSSGQAIMIAHVAAGAAGEGVGGIPLIGKVLSFISGSIKTLSPYIFSVVILLLATGFVLAIYIPFVPFIIWFSAIMNWLLIVIEAVVAAPLWAAAHLINSGRREEEGVGERSLHGYIFLFNVILRPMLMVVGFLAGSSMVIIGGTALNLLFSTVVANTQYDTSMGIFTVIGLCYIYVVLSLNLIHSSFSAIFVFPDQVINWIGGQAASNLGRDANEQGKSFMAVAGRRSETTARDLRADHKNKPPKPPKGDGFTQ